MRRAPAKCICALPARRSPIPISTASTRRSSRRCSPPTTSLEEMRDFIGVASLAFLSVDGLYRAVGYPGRDPVRPQFTDHCFTGDYPTPLTDQAANPQPRASCRCSPKPADLMAGRLAGRVALVTGASRGIGHAVASAIAAEGRACRRPGPHRRRPRGTRRRPSRRRAAAPRWCPPTSRTTRRSTGSEPRCSSVGASSTS